MADTYWLSFRINDDATYDVRYNKLIDAVDKLCPAWWLDTSSFILFTSDQDIDGVAAKVKVAINPSTDVVLIGKPDYKTARLIGKSDLPKVQAFMPFTKKA